MTVCSSFLIGQNLEFKKYNYDNDLANLHFTFDIPKTWTIKIENNETGFSALCKPTTKEERSIYNYCFEGIIFRIQYFKSDLDSTLKSKGLYRKNRDTYITSDRVSDSVKTQTMLGETWIGLYHLNICGVTCIDNGFHGAAGECEYIYFSHGEQTICISTNGKAFEKNVLERIKSSFSFTRVF
jgi:hypothetical protein